MRELGVIVFLLVGLTVWAARWTPEPAAPPSGGPEVPPRVEPASTVAAPGTVRLHAQSLAIVAEARERLAEPDPAFRADCSGYVASTLAPLGLLERFGLPLDATVATFWANAEERGSLHYDPVPRIGDLAFFDNTWDRDGNGRMDDRRTHIAIVVDVEPDGTIVLAHKGTDYRLIRMNLFHPLERHGPDGVEWNSWLRRTGDRGNPLGLYTTGALWSGFASLEPPRPETLSSDMNDGHPVTDRW